MASAQSVKISQALELMSNLERLKQECRFCNFTVKVGEESFSVDRNVLAASSPYFDALFSSNMEETNAGVVDMKEIDANAVKTCLGFMYSGEANLQMGSIYHTLHAANFLQLQHLLNLCFDHMEDHLSPQNCIQVMMLAETYSNENLKKKAYEVLTSKLKDVISSNTLRQLNRSDFSQCLKDSEADHKTIWNAALSWVKEKNQEENSLLDVFVKCGFGKFPIKFFLETVLEEPRVNNDVNFVRFVTDAIFSDVKKLAEEIGDDVEKCFKLKNSLEVLGKDADEKNIVLTKFFVKNVANVLKKPEFHNLSDHFVKKILQESNCSEESKYEALLRWTKHDLKDRKKHFPTLFKLIKLEMLSLNFLKQKVQSESLVGKSPECYKFLMNMLFIIAEKNSSKMPSLSTKTPSSTKITSSTEEPSTSSDLPFSSSKIPSSSTKTFSGTKNFSSSKMPSFSAKTSSGTEEPSTSSDLPSSSAKMPSSSTTTSFGTKDSSKMIFRLSSEICCFKCKNHVNRKQRLHFICCGVHAHESCVSWNWKHPRCPKCGKLEELETCSSRNALKRSSAQKPAADFYKS